MGRKDVEESEYGYLYIASREIFDLELCLDRVQNVMFLPVGYQPMMRCNSQYAYTAYTKNVGSFDIYKDPHFKAFRFKHDPVFAKWVFDICGCGSEIYPSADVPYLSEYMAEINGSTEVQR